MEAVISGGFGLWALVALAQSGPAASVPVRVEFDAPAGCSDAEAFWAGMLARTRHVHRARAGETPVRLTVRVTRAGARVRGELRVNEAGGEAETRRVDGATCAEVVQVLSLTAALAIDPTASLLGPAGSEKPPSTGAPVRAPPVAGAAASPRSAAAGPGSPPSPGRAASGAASTPVTAPASAPSPTASSPAASSRTAPAQLAARPAPPPAERSPEAGATSASPPTVALGPEPGAAALAEPSLERAHAVTPRFGASVVAARVLTSSLAVGGSFWGRFGIATRGGLTPSLTLAALYLPGDFFESGDDLGIGWIALAATACPGWALGGRVRIEPCARITAGALSATDHSVNSPRSVTRWWGSAGALVRLTAPLGAGLMLDLDGGVDFPFVTRRFITTTTSTTLINQPVGETTAVSPTLSVGLSHRL